MANRDGISRHLCKLLIKYVFISEVLKQIMSRRVSKAPFSLGVFWLRSYGVFKPG